MVFGRMAGHSKYKNIMHRKNAQDKKRASLHGRVTREIMVAVRLGGGGDADRNARLRLALLSARAANMTKDAVSRAIARASGENQQGSYQEVRYEAFGAHGVAFIVETATDNRNRTAAELRAIFSKHGGNLGQDGSVSHLFEHMGHVFYSHEQAQGDAVFDVACEVNPQDIEQDDEGCHIITAVDDYHEVVQHCVQSLGAPQSASLVWRPLTEIEVSQETAATLQKCTELLEDNQDVVAVFSNYSLVA